MKSERLTLLVTGDFKARLERDAKRRRISVAQLIRQQFDPVASTPDEQELIALTQELRRSTREVRQALADAHIEASKTQQVFSARRRSLKRGHGSR